jgi:hypothetical protein
LASRGRGPQLPSRTQRISLSARCGAAAVDCSFVDSMILLHRRYAMLTVPPSRPVPAIRQARIAGAARLPAAMPPTHAFVSLGAHAKLTGRHVGDAADAPEADAFGPAHRPRSGRMPTLCSLGSPRGEADRDDATTEFGDVLILNGKHMSSRHAELRLGPCSAAGFSCRRCLPQIVGRSSRPQTLLRRDLRRALPRCCGQPCIAYNCDLQH